MNHFLLMILFAALVAIVFGVTGKQTVNARILYGAKVFGEFVGIGLILAWLMYLLF